MAFNGEFPKRISGYDKEAIFDLAFRGGYPEAVLLKTQKERKDWHKDYLDTLIARDLKDIANIREKSHIWV